MLDLFVYVCLFGGFCFFIYELIKYGAADDVYAIFYFTCLAFCLSTVLVLWARSSNALDANANPHSQFAVWLIDMFGVATDFELDIKVFAAIAAVVVAPQILGYILSGFFGCASAPVLLKPLMLFVLWTTVKFLAVSAGIQFSLLFFHFGDYNLSVPNGDRYLLHNNPFEICITLGLSFGILSAYRHLVSQLRPEAISQYPFDKWLSELLARYRSWATRNQPPRPNITAKDVLLTAANYLIRLFRRSG